MTKKYSLIWKMLLFGLIVAFAFIEGFRMPNLWSANYYLPSFFDGFYRRSLPGTLLFFLGEYKFNYYVIATIQFFVLFSLLLWLFWAFAKNSLTMVIVTAYLASACGGFLFHEVGYVDQLLYLVLFVSLWLYDKHRVASLLLFSSSRFIHELALFATVPLYFIYVYLRTDDIIKSVQYIILPVVLFILIYLFFQTLPIEKIHQFMDQIKTYANYAYRYDYYGVFVNEFTGERYKLHYGVDAVAPLVLLTMMQSVIGVIVYQLKKNLMIALLVALSGVAPLFLGLFGYDLNRWFFLSFSSLTAAFIMFVLHYHISFSDVMSQKWGVVLVMSYLLFVGNMRIGYFEGDTPRNINSSAIMEIQKKMLQIPKL